MSRSERLGFNSFLLVIVVAFGLIALTYESQASQIPFLVALVAGIMLLAQGWIDFKGATPESGDAEEEDSEDVGWKGPLITFACVVGFVFMIWLVGYLIAVPLFAALSMIYIGRVRWKTALAVTAVLWAFIFVLLELLLQANLS